MLIGNVGQDPEVRYLDNSQAKVARLRLATTERFTDRNGESRENTEWHTVTCWRRLADLVEKYVRKGSQIYVEGRLQTREWTDNSGAKRFSTEVSADNIQLLGRRSEASGAEPASTHTPGVGSGPGGYESPYQPAAPSKSYTTPGSEKYSAPSVPTGSTAPDFGAGADDDLPF